MKSCAVKGILRGYKLQSNEVPAEAATRGVLQKKSIPEKFAIVTGKQLFWSLFLSNVLWKNDSNIGVFLWILEIYKNTYFTEHLQTAGSVLQTILNYVLYLNIWDCRAR